MLPSIDETLIVKSWLVESSLFFLSNKVINTFPFKFVFSEYKSLPLYKPTLYKFVEVVKIFTLIAILLYPLLCNVCVGK